MLWDNLIIKKLKNLILKRYLWVKYLLEICIIKLLMIIRKNQKYKHSLKKIESKKNKDGNFYNWIKVLKRCNNTKAKLNKRNKNNKEMRLKLKELSWLGNLKIILLLRFKFKKKNNKRYKLNNSN